MAITKRDVQLCAEKLTNRYGLELSGELVQTSEGVACIFQPTQIPDREGFNLRITLGWRRIMAEFEPGKFSAELIRSMGAADETNKLVFASLVSAINMAGGGVAITINGSKYAPDTPEGWPRDWNSFELSLKSNLVDTDIDLSQSAEAVNHLLQWGGWLLGLSIALLPLEEVEFVGSQETILGMPEGAVSRVEVNRYERSRVNRAACIAINGCQCKVCGIDFGSVYGVIGEGYIHVHHIVPVSQLGAGYVIDPVRELVPVCPNCHAMLHRNNPPYSVSDLQSMLLDAHNG